MLSPVALVDLGGAEGATPPPPPFIWGMPPHPPRLSRLWCEVALSSQLLQPPVSEFPGSAPEWGGVGEVGYFVKFESRIKMTWAWIPYFVL